MSELTLRNRQRVRALNLRFFRKITQSLLQERLGENGYEISVHIVAASEMAKLNQRYLHHAGSTDVITFGYSELESAGPILGDIFISIDDAVRQAREFRTSWQEELLRYFVHGILHLQGYDDSQVARRRVMKREENRIVQQLKERLQLGKLRRASVDR